LGRCQRKGVSPGGAVGGEDSTANLSALQGGGRPAGEDPCLGMGSQGDVHLIAPVFFTKKEFIRYRNQGCPLFGFHDLESTGHQAALISILTD